MMIKSNNTQRNKLENRNITAMKTFIFPKTERFVEIGLGTHLNNTAREQTV